MQKLTDWKLCSVKDTEALLKKKYINVNGKILFSQYMYSGLGNGTVKTLLHKLKKPGCAVQIYQKYLCYFSEKIRKSLQWECKTKKKIFLKQSLKKQMTWAAKL